MQNSNHAMRLKQFSRRSNLNRNLQLLLNRNRGHWKRRKKRDWEISMRFLKVRMRNRGRRNKRRSELELEMESERGTRLIQDGTEGKGREFVPYIPLALRCQFRYHSVPVLYLTRCIVKSEREVYGSTSSRALARSGGAGKCRFTIVSALKKK